MPNSHLWQANAPGETFALYRLTSMRYQAVIELATRYLSVAMAQLFLVARTASFSETMLGPRD